MTATRRAFLAACRGWRGVLHPLQPALTAAAVGQGGIAVSSTRARGRTVALFSSTASSTDHLLGCDADASCSGRVAATFRQRERSLWFRDATGAGDSVPLLGSAPRGRRLFSSLRGVGLWGGQQPGSDGDPPPAETLSHFLTDLFDAGRLGFWSARLTAAARRSSIAEFPTIKEEFTWSYLERQGFRDCELDQMVARYPGLLELSVNRSIEPALMFLRSLGLSEEELHAMVSAQPGLLALGVVEELEPVVSFLRSSGLSQPETLEVLAARPWVFEAGVAELRRYEATLETFGMRWWEAGPLMQALLGAERRPDCLAETAAYLLHDLGLPEPEVQAFGKFQPWLLAMTAEEVRSRVDFLCKQGLKTPEVANLLVTTPGSVLRSSMQELRSRLAVLATLAELGKWKTAGALLAAHPQLAEASVSRLQYLHRIFASRGVAGESLIQLLVAQSNPMKWATDLLTLQLPRNAGATAPKAL